MSKVICRVQPYTNQEIENAAADYCKAHEALDSSLTLIDFLSIYYYDDHHHHPSRTAGGVPNLLHLGPSDTLIHHCENVLAVSYTKTKENQSNAVISVLILCLQLLGDSVYARTVGSRFVLLIHDLWKWKGFGKVNFSKRHRKALSGNTERHPVSLTQHEIRAPRRARGRRGI
jgi:hypothetical protein